MRAGCGKRKEGGKATRSEKKRRGENRRSMREGGEERRSNKPANIIHNTYLDVTFSTISNIPSNWPRDPTEIPLCELDSV